MAPSFGARLENAFASRGHLCVGIDPHAALLADWGLDDNVAGLRAFGLGVLEAAVGRVGIIKPQVSFFERHGSAGFAVLEEIAREAANTDLLVVMDAKRGDIGTTMDGYFDAWLAQDAPFICDALTVSPYLGFDSLAGVMSQCQDLGKGLFVLAATSNPEGKSLQTAKTPNGPLAADIWQRLARVNSVTGTAPGALGSFGAVVGATLDLRAFGIDFGGAAQATPILAPGFGAQGAELSDAGTLFAGAQRQLVASVSRSVLSAGPNGIAVAIERSAKELAHALDE